MLELRALHCARRASLPSVQMLVAHAARTRRGRSRGAFVLDHLREAISNAAARADVAEQENVLEAMGCLGCVARGDFLLGIVVGLLEYLAAENPLLRATSFRQLQVIARARGQTVSELLKSRLATVGELIATRVRTRPALVHELALLCGPAAHAFDDLPASVSRADERTAAFLHEMTQYVLPAVVAAADGEALQELAKLMNVGGEFLMFNNAHYALAHVLTALQEQKGKVPLSRAAEAPVCACSRALTWPLRLRRASVQCCSSSRP